MNLNFKWVGGIFLSVLCIFFDIIIATNINHHYDKRASIYRLALKTTNKDKFNYIVDSQQGNVITNAKLTAVSPVQFREMKSNQTFFAVKRTLEEYTMHTKTTTDSKGRTTTTTYWTWDDQGTDYKYAKQFEMFGRKYKLAKFDISSYFDHIDAKKIVNGDNGLTGYYHYLDSDTRYRYEVVPTTITGTFIAQAVNNTLKPVKGHSYIKVTHEKYKEYLADKQSKHRPVTIVVIIILLLVEAWLIINIIIDW